MKAYKGTFIKNDGSFREMVFVRIHDITIRFLSEKMSGTVSPKTLKPGQELVWDLEADDWRIFNWNTVKGEVTETEVSEDLFV